MTGLAGVVYAVVVAARALRQRTYKPVWQDWVWYAALPGLCYAAIFVTAFRDVVQTQHLFVIGGAALALLLIGIHNAWDTVTHIVLSESDSNQ